MLALFISHGVSFVQNYLLKGEYATAKPDKLMGNPYGRVVVMHITILIGGFLTMAIGSPAPLLIVLVGLKTILDVSLHNNEHKKAQIGWANSVFAHTDQAKSSMIYGPKQTP